MGILDNLATKIADKVNNKNDEVMLLTQENDSLRQDNAALTLTKSDYQSKINNQDEKLKEARRIELVNSKEIDRLHKNQDSLILRHQEKVDNLVEKAERDGYLIQDYAEQIFQLSNNKPDKKLKQRNKELEEQLKQSENLIKNNATYRMTYEHISDSSNRQSVIDCFSHNLSVWLKDKRLNDTQASKLLKCNRDAIGAIKRKVRIINVETIQIFDIELCEYFKCSVYELVTEKLM